MSNLAGVPALVRRGVAARRHPELPLLDRRAVTAAAVASAGLYLLLTAWALPGVADIVAALPVGARLGVLLLVSTVTRFAAGWLAARRYRAGHGLPERSVALPSAALGGAIGFAVVGVLGLVGGLDVGLAAVLLDAVRWPVECCVGALLAVPGDRPDDPVHVRQASRATRTRNGAPPEPTWRTRP